MLIHQLKQPLIEIIQKRMSVQFVIVVGSFAKGTEHANSDIDLVYKSEQALTASEHAALVAELEHISGREVDLINFDNVDAEFRVHVLKTGLPIYIYDEAEFEHFKARMID